MNYCFFPSWFGSRSHLIWGVVSFSIIAWSLLLVCFLLFLFDVTRMKEWQIENRTVQTCLSWEGDNSELSTQQNLLTRRCTVCWSGAEERLLLMNVTQCKRLTKLCSFGVLCARLHFPLWIWKLIIYCSPWEDWHGAVDLQGWCHRLWWVAVPCLLAPQLSSRLIPFSCRGRGSLPSFH